MTVCRKPLVPRYLARERVLAKVLANPLKPGTRVNIKSLKRDGYAVIVKTMIGKNYRGKQNVDFLCNFVTPIKEVMLDPLWGDVELTYNWNHANPEPSYVPSPHFLEVVYDTEDEFTVTKEDIFD